MSISDISSKYYNYFQNSQSNGQSNMQQVGQDFNSLVQALQSENLSGTQSSGLALQQLLSSSSSTVSSQTQVLQLGNVDLDIRLEPVPG